MKATTITIWIVINLVWIHRIIAILIALAFHWIIAIITTMLSIHSTLSRQHSPIATNLIIIILIIIASLILLLLLQVQHVYPINIPTKANPRMHSSSSLLNLRNLHHLLVVIPLLHLSFSRRFHLIVISKHTYLRYFTKVQFAR